MLASSSFFKDEFHLQLTRDVIARFVKSFRLVSYFLNTKQIFKIGFSKYDFFPFVKVKRKDRC